MRWESKKKLKKKYNKIIWAIFTELKKKTNIIKKLKPMWKVQSLKNYFFVSNIKK